MRFYSHKSFMIPESLGNDGETYQISKLPHIQTQVLNPSYSFSKELQSITQGKKLLIYEITYPLEEIHNHYIQGYISYHPGIIRENNHFQCFRCGNKEQRLFASFHCARCNEKCTYCRKCINMGRVSECTPVILWLGPNRTKENQSELNWHGTLSSGQQHASNEVTKAIQFNQKLLVWAVCGSGKTEVLFEGIKHALDQGKQICLTTPRTDVVLELLPRMKTAFPATEIVGLYGGIEDNMKQGQLTIATTHQLIRYYKWFDVVIIDEVDAFPYSIDLMLQYAVSQVSRDRSSEIYLSATPNVEMQKQSKSGELTTVTIPARYHRHPLDIPDFKWCGNWRKLIKKQSLPTKIISWIQEHLKKQAFLFVPDVETLEITVEILKKVNSNIEGVHANDENRKGKIEAFRNGVIPILITTTILERGVTVPNVDVAVLGAEDRIFTESALVQISGRVGRSASYPCGTITFYHFGITKAMKAARLQIIKMNKEAERKGMIKS